MLTVEPAASGRRSQRRIALALAGGGPLGAFYQLGCLHALAECTEGLDLAHLDAYVGVSSGAIIAAALANRIPTQEMVRLFPLDDEQEMEEVKELIRKFGEYTDSERAWRFLEQWDAVAAKFVKVYPNDYRRVLETQKRYQTAGLDEDEAIMAAFEENARDLARVGGK